MSDLQTYSNPQAIVSSDRIVLNAKKDNAYILSNNIISLSARSLVTIDVGDVNNATTSNRLIVNAPAIQLGISKNNSTNLEAVVKADSLDNILGEMITLMNDVLTILAPDLTNTAPLAQVLLQTKGQQILDELNSYHSQITYTY